jgi:transcriptional regulator with XRE-family HTH domain
MGNARLKPDRLAEKLREIRVALGLSQTEMLRHLGFDESMKYARISEYEQGHREPNLMTLLAYARTAGVYVEDIIDDELDLPAKLPGNFRHQGLKRKSSSRKR